MKRAFLIRGIVGIVVIVFVVGTWAVDGKFDFGWLKFFSAAVLVATIFMALWDSWLWRLSLVQKLPGVPRCVRGTWRGTLTSFWVDNDGSGVPPKIVYLIVRQTSTLVSVTLLTNESKSASKLADISGVDGHFSLDYLYLNRPDARFEHRSRIHHGSTVLDISGAPAVRLRGRYWTDRDSKGELDFDQRRKELADDFDQAAKLFA